MEITFLLLTKEGNSMNPALLAIGGLVARHVLTAAGAYLVTKGYADESTAQAVIGSVTTILGLGWSIFQKHNSGAMAPKE